MQVSGRVVNVPKRNRNDPVKFDLVTSEGEKINATCHSFCPVEEGDAVVGLGKVVNGRVVFSNPPFVQIAADRDSVIKGFIKCLRGKGIGNFKATALYNAISKDAGGDDNVCAFMSDLALKYHGAEGEKVLEEYSMILEVGLLKKIMEWWHQKRHYRRLHLLGLNNGEIHKCIDMNLNIVEVYERCILNPYMLAPLSMVRCEEIMGRLFRSPTKEQIYCGTVVREIYRQMENGSVGVDLPTIQSLFPDIGDYLEILLSKYDLVFVHGLICFKYVDEIESTVSEFMKKMVAGEYKTYATIVDPFHNSRLLSDEQKEAVAGALKNDICVITGGAGTGKTTIIKELIAQLELQEIPYAIASFTGKAVARIREVTGRRSPATLNMMISRGPSSYDFLHLIIDEASMVTTQLFYQFIRAFPDRYRITLIGDINQLPPISWGSLFEEVIKSQVVPVYRLNHNFRLDKDKISGEDMILANADRIIEHVKPFKFIQGDNFMTIEGSEERVFDLVRVLYASATESKDVVIITPYNEVLDGLNSKFQQIYNDGNASVLDERKKLWMVGDRVMMTENNYDINVMNGEEGIVVEVEPVKIHVKFNSVIYCFDLTYPEAEDEPLVKLSVKKLTHSFAITVHKSQGSQKRFVIIYIPTSRANFGFLTCNLCYTAVTRAQQAVWCIGDIKALEAGVVRLPPPRQERLAVRLAEKS